MNIHYDAERAAARAEALLECRRIYQAELERVSSFVDMLTDRINAIDVELSASETVVSWRRQ